MNGRRYLDFAGGVGAVLLGYADPEVNAAVRRRLAAGTYCTLVNPQEVELAVAHTESHIAQLLECIDAVMGEISQVIENGRLAGESGVARGPRGFSRLA